LPHVNGLQRFGVSATFAKAAEGRKTFSKRRLSSFQTSPRLTTPRLLFVPRGHCLLKVHFENPHSSFSENISFTNHVGAGLNFLPYLPSSTYLGQPSKPIATDCSSTHVIMMLFILLDRSLLTTSQLPADCTCHYDAIYLVNTKLVHNYNMNILYKKRQVYTPKKATQHPDSTNLHF
jgi:hypothetical protein